jgi:N-acetylglucosamine-6-phosphate deacetylase
MIPGFIDLQVNGYDGVNFTSRALTPEGVLRVRERLYARGTVAFCPTVTTTAPAVYAHCLPILAGSDDAGDASRNLGIHVEGPFISAADGPRGVHRRRHVAPPTIEAFERLRALAEDRIAILTLAPELDGALRLIEHVVENTRTLVAIGHTEASAEVIDAAVSAGARLATHLGNGLADMIHRHNNPLWPLLADDRVTATCITDGFHVPEAMIRVALRAKGVERFVVTSDVVHLAGRPPGEYDLHGVAVVLEANGHLHRKGAYQLAGASRDMLDCMNHLASLGVLREAELAAVGFSNAARLLGMEAELQDMPQQVTFGGARYEIS